MSKDRREIIKDMHKYFASSEVCGGRWSVEEVSMRINKDINNAIEVKVILLQHAEYKTLNDLR